MHKKFAVCVALALVLAMTGAGVAHGGRTIYATLEQVNALIAEAVAGVEAQVDALALRVGLIETGVPALEAKVAELEARVQTLEGESSSTGGASPFESFAITGATSNWHDVVDDSSTRRQNDFTISVDVAWKDEATLWFNTPDPAEWPTVDVVCVIKPVNYLDPAPFGTRAYMHYQRCTITHDALHNIGTYPMVITGSFASGNTANWPYFAQPVEVDVYINSQGFSQVLHTQLPASTL